MTGLNGFQIIDIPRGMGGKKVETYGEGRVCEKEGCGTKLSRYNKNDRCSVHAATLVYPYQWKAGVPVGRGEGDEWVKFVVVRGCAQKGVPGYYVFPEDAVVWVKESELKRRRPPHPPQIEEEA